ncbi:hypothetical protein M427DRAFT_72152 [Gonapodya prolifera JEL478]|uniref:Uncharacterized protein n=1 Tax=Gonapodya prolifera (strain JEL478) TaxID=1344416 RepID=A0A139A6B4_GONPJ|nr:hypothetical protein M427DRAFT_72152 [Gonapodya prolifera JEL478]|eukprot:KXS12360.1 hypothetical protein M427DRAFT_72152 [Gonapodya prolifera JEL478]
MKCGPVRNGGALVVAVPLVGTGFAIQVDIFLRGLRLLGVKVPEEPADFASAPGGNRSKRPAPLALPPPPSAQPHKTRPAAAAPPAFPDASALLVHSNADSLADLMTWDPFWDTHPAMAMFIGHAIMSVRVAARLLELHGVDALRTGLRTLGVVNPFSLITPFLVVMKEALRASTAPTTDDAHYLVVQNAIDGFGGYETFRAMTGL